MNWKLIFFLSLFGIVMGLLSIFGFTRGIEWILWIVIAVICAAVISKKQSPKYFAHGLVTGLLDGVYNGIIQSAFYSMYLQNNPESIEGFRQSPVNPRFFVLLMGPLIGLIYGCVIGFFAVLYAKVSKRKTN